MPASINERVRKRRDALRAQGLRAVQIWVPDMRRTDLAEECHRQSVIVAQADRSDSDLQGFLDSALADLEEDNG
jgi:hypothetical protein